MSYRRFLLILGSTLALSACGKKADDTAAAPRAPIAAVAPPAGTRWTEIHVATPEGGFRMGNPNAPVKLIEYASPTCPHCRDFTAEAADPLRANYIASGKVSWEFRPFMLNALDVPVTLLASCQGPAPFFKLVEQLYASQTEWIEKFQKLSPAEQQAMQRLAPADQFKAMASAMGLDTFLRVRGLPAAKADACLADQAAADRLIAIRDRATNEEGVTSTPSFLIDGRLQDNVATWPQLEQKLKAAIG